MRCDDDYVYGDCYLHGPYNPDATPQSIADDFLIFCVLASRANALPKDWDWDAFLKAAACHVPFAFEKSDAQERWGSENVFAAMTGGRSLRYTAEVIYKSPANGPNSDQYIDVEEETEANMENVRKETGGVAVWNQLVADVVQCHRFA